MSGPSLEPGGPILPPHGLSVVLVEPQIAPNAGNIARLCVATGTALHLVRPLGFRLDDRSVRRSAMDYWPRVRLTVHDDLSAFFSATAGARYWLFSSKASQAHWDVRFATDDFLIFGSETAGLDENLLAAHAPRTLRIPQVAGERCLNLSTAAGIGLYEAMRQLSADAAIT